MASPWDPAQYERFKDERRQPFFDLMALVRPAAGMAVVDLGCGTGELTAELHRTLHASATTGIDSSETMLARSAAFAAPGLSFAPGDLAAWTGARDVDLVFSNAALHWVDRHDEVLARWAAALRPGGQIAVQVPDNHEHPSHVVAAEVAREEPFATALSGHVRRWTVGKPEWYAAVLDRLGFHEQHVRLQVYGHHLGGRGDVVEWVKGTLLTDYQKRMAPELYARFLDRYRERLLPRLADERPFFYPFRRLLFWGRLESS